MQNAISAKADGRACVRQHIPPPVFLVKTERLAEVNRAENKTMPTKPTVIMGDFNEWSATAGMMPFKTDYNVHTAGLTFHASRPVAALDRFVISHDVQLKSSG